MGFFGIGAQNQPPEEPKPQQQDGTIQEILGVVKQLMEENQKITAQVQQLQAQRQEQYPRPESPFPEERLQPATKEKRGFSDLSADEVDELTPQEMYRMMLDEVEDRVNSKLGEAVDPLKQQFESLSQESQRSQQYNALEQVMYERDAQGQLIRPDFGDWVDEIKSLRQEMPGANYRRLYQLARMENGTKAQELDTKYHPERAAPKESNVFDFGGLAPNLMKKTIDGGDLSVSDAARQAVDRVRETRGPMPSATAIEAANL